MSAPDMRWLHELVWLALALLVVTALTCLVASLILGPATGGMG